MSTSLPAPSTIPHLSSQDREKLLNLLFEPSSALYKLVEPILMTQACTSYVDLIEEIRKHLHAVHDSVIHDADNKAGQSLLDSTLNAHPRLGSVRVSGLSKGEQASLVGTPTGSTASAESETGKVSTTDTADSDPASTYTACGASQETAASQAELRELNDEYERTFTGLRFVTFVNARSKDEVKKEMKARIAEGDIQLERRRAADAMCDIALDRARKLRIG